MSSRSLEMRSAGMVSGLVVLLELGAGLSLRIDVKDDPIRVLDGEATITPRMVFKLHDRSQTRSREQLELSVDIGHAEVVRQAGRIANGLIWLGCHELKGCALPEFQIDVPATVEGDLCAEVLDVEVTGLLDLCCSDTGGQCIGKHGDSLL